MEYLVKALRDTYYNERQAYPGLNDLIDMLEDDELGMPHYLGTYSLRAVLSDIEDSLKDINLPIQEDV